jgi:hypothetical protein
MSQSWYQTGMMGLGTNGNGVPAGGGMVVRPAGILIGAGVTAAIGAGIAHFLDRDLKYGAGIGAALSLITSGYLNYSATGRLLPPANGVAVAPVANNGAVAGCGCC